VSKVGEGAGAAADKAKVPALAAGMAAAGLAGGIAIGRNVLSRKKVLGVPVAPKRRTAFKLGMAAGGLGKSGKHVAGLTDEVRGLRSDVAGGSGPSTTQLLLAELARLRS
jgi:hypothetical protein